jgi:hypothetical protein
MNSLEGNAAARDELPSATVNRGRERRRPHILINEYSRRTTRLYHRADLLQII